MMNQSHRTVRSRAAILVVAAAALGGCAASSQEFVPPPPPRTGLAEQIRVAQDFAARAQVAEREKRYDDAMALYTQALASYRDFPGVWHNLGLLQLQKGDTLRAVESLKTASDLEPRDPRPLYNIGVIYQQQGWIEEAQKYYADALARDAGFLDALRQSVYLDVSKNVATPVTLERTQRALLIEPDAQWRLFFERTKLRLDVEFNQPATESGAIVVPETLPGSDR